MSEATKKHCGACALMLEENIYGVGYCAMLPLFTDVYCGDEACEEFIPKDEP